MKKQEKAARSFDYQCKKASRCRHEKYMISCNCCSEHETCEIQKAVNLAHKNMY
jgi:hypothetical protein